MCSMPVYVCQAMDTPLFRDFLIRADVEKLQDLDLSWSAEEWKELLTEMKFTLLEISKLLAIIQRCEKTDRGEAI